jgi:hypothetical protein
MVHLLWKTVIDLVFKGVQKLVKRLAEGCGVFCRVFLEGSNKRELELYICSSPFESMETVRASTELKTV